MEKSNLGGVVAIPHDPWNNTILVLDPTRKNPKKKFPGGGVEPFDKDVVAAALRELFEETGLGSKEEQKTFLTNPVGVTYRSDRKGYTHYVSVEVPFKLERKNLNEFGNDGEEIYVVSLDDILSGKIEILKTHKDFIDSLLKQPERSQT